MSFFISVSDGERTELGYVNWLPNLTYVDEWEIHRGTACVTVSHDGFWDIQSCNTDLVVVCKSGNASLGNIFPVMCACRNERREALDFLHTFESLKGDERKVAIEKHVLAGIP